MQSPLASVVPLLAEDQEAAEGVVLARAVLGPTAVRREHGLADVVRDVMGEVVPVLRMGDVRQVAQCRLGLAQERRAALLIDRDPFEPARRHECIDGALLHGRQGRHRHGRSPMIATVALRRTWVRKPLCSSISSGVMIVALTSRPTWSPTRWHAS